MFGKSYYLRTSLSAIAAFAPRQPTPAPVPATDVVIDESAALKKWSHKWAHASVKPLPPKRRGENREQYRRRLRESGLIG